MACRMSVSEERTQTRVMSVAIRGCTGYHGACRSTERFRPCVPMSIFLSVVNLFAKGFRFLLVSKGKTGETFS